MRDRRCDRRSSPSAPKTSQSRLERGQRKPRQYRLLWVRSRFASSAHLRLMRTRMAHKHATWGEEEATVGRGPDGKFNKVGTCSAFTTRGLRVSVDRNHTTKRK